MTAALDLLVVGDVDIDVYLRVPRLPTSGEKVRGELLGLFPGGVAANVAVAARRLGLASGVHGVVGDDVHGQLTRTSLVTEGVDVTALLVDPDHPTFLCVVHLDGTGEKALTLAETPTIFPRRDQLDRAALQRARRVHVAPFDLDVAADAAATAAAASRSVSVDLEPGSIGAGLGDVADLLGHVAICFVNHHGAQRLAGVDDPTAAIAPLHELGPPVVILTTGEDGAVVSVAGGDPVHVAAVPTATVDTTGAGDAFCAAVLERLTAGHGPVPAVRAAVHAGALACRAVGAQSASPTATDLEAALTAAARRAAPDVHDAATHDAATHDAATHDAATYGDRR